MLRWLKNDLAQTKQDWIIAYGHHSPYSKALHDSDEDQFMTAVRTRILPILENGGADLVLSGHTHASSARILLTAIMGFHRLSPTRCHPSLALNLSARYYCWLTSATRADAL
ncbi:MAG TPA: hypothetical protein ENI11_03545 [Actinobacteria bacterium]|nr:hypothetical protein [Actinomycetota bacterium]